jgi:hypothetical protein
MEVDCFGMEVSHLQRTWQLFSGPDGVAAAEELERGYEAGKWEFAELPIKESGSAMWDRMMPRMERFAHQGARDSEPLWYLADRIARDLSDRHGIKVEFSRWTGQVVG